ncbi:MAG TPA: nuclear transport factor 2 family protein [Chitinophagaceae bacterium]|jgi:limonene-1,2-epoxide hydrolase
MADKFMTDSIISPRQIVLAFINALNEENFEHARDLVDDDFKFEGVLASRNGAEAYFADMQKMRLKYGVKKVFAEGNDVCVIYEISMEGTNVLTCGLYHVTEGRLDSLRVIFDPRAVLQKA